MPYIIKKVRNTGCYQVINKLTGKIHSYCTTKLKAEAQLRILQRTIKKN